MPNYLTSQGKTFYLALDAKTPVFAVAGFTDFFSSKRLRTLKVTTEKAIFEIIPAKHPSNLLKPPMDLGIESIDWPSSKLDEQWA